MNDGKPGETPQIDKLLQEALDLLRRTSKLLMVSLVLLVIGFFGGPGMGNGFFWFIFILGFILLGIWLLRRYPRILGREQVVDQWRTLIPDGQGRADNIFEDTQQLVFASKAPDIKMEHLDVTPSIIRGLFSGKRPFLVLSHTINSNLKPFRMYLNARDYGDNLQVSWYVVQQPGFWHKMVMILLFIPFLNFFVLPFWLFGRLTRAREAGFLDLDLFDQQDLTAFVTNAHRCLLGAVEKLMMDLNQDPSKLDRKSRGFLGIS